MENKKMPIERVGFIILGTLLIIGAVLLNLKLAKEIFGDEQPTSCCQHQLPSDNFIGGIWDNIDKMSVLATACQKVGSDTTINGIKLCRVAVKLPWGADTLFTYAAYLEESPNVSISGKAIIIPGEKFHGFFFKEKNDLLGITIAVLTNEGPKHTKARK